MRKVPKAEGEKKPKICTIYRKLVQIANFSLPHPSGAPSSEGATKQEPLRLILTCSISTVPTLLRLRGRTPREGRPYGRIGRPFDKSEISNSPFLIRKLSTVHYQLSTYFGLLCPNFPNVLHFSLAYLSILCYTQRGR